MKKLIMCAAMAVVGGMTAFGYIGDSNVYAIKLNLKTTKAATSKSTSKTYTVNFGMDAKKDGNFWYMDSAITKNAAYPTYGDIAGYEKVVSYDGAFKASAAEFSAFFYALDGDEQLEVVQALGYNPSTQKSPYNYKSANKWCQSFKIKVVTDSECYRVDGTEKIVGYIVANNCCGGWMICDTNFENAEPIDVICNYRYGSNVDEKAKKVEMKLSIGAFGDLNSIVLGGHGSYDVANQRISSVSGYAIGMIPGPSCESCCAASVQAKVFECDGTKTEAIDTVAYGTFTVSFDKKATEKFNAD